MVARCNDVRYVANSRVVQFANPDIRKMIYAHVSGRCRSGAHGSSRRSQVANVRVCVHEARQEPLAFEVQDLGRSSSLWCIVPNALNVAVHNNYGRTF